MKNIILTIIVTTIYYAALAQADAIKKSFDHLKSVTVQNYPEVKFTFDSSTTVVYNNKYAELKTKPLPFVEEDLECEAGTVVLAEILFDKSNKKKFLLTFGVCPEYEFCLYDLNTKKLVSSFFATEITIPGNGSVYTAGHLSNFNLRQKFVLKDTTFHEVKQPFYYVGLKSKTLRDIKIYSDKEQKQLLAVIPKNHEIEVLMADVVNNSNLYLVRTGFGLAGWATLVAAQYESVDVEGLFYNND